MPSIMSNPDQQKALEEVTAKMELIEGLNQLTNGKVSAVTVSALGSGKAARKSPKVTLTASDRELQRILSALTDYKRRVTREVKEKAKRYSITFSPAELRLLDEKAQDVSTEEDAADSLEEVLPDLSAQEPKREAPGGGNEQDQEFDELP